MSRGVFALSPGVFRFGGELDSYQSGQFRSGVPNGVLQVTTPGLTEDEANTLKARWMAVHGGGRRSIAVLNATTQFTPLNLSPVDAALTEVKKLNVADVAFAFGMDPNMLGAGLQNSASYNNVRDYFRQHRDLTLGPWIAALQDLLTSLLPGTQGVRVDLDQFTRAEPAERYAAYAAALSAGIITVNEVRQLEGLPPLPEDTSAQDVPDEVDDGLGSDSPPESQTTRAARDARIVQLLGSRP
jgi:HK97 family phage portal protein